MRIIIWAAFFLVDVAIACIVGTAMQHKVVDELNQISRAYEDAMDPQYWGDGAR